MSDTVRNVLIVVGIALVITVSTTAGAVAALVFWIVRLLLLAAFGYLAYTLWRQNRHRISLMSQGRQALLYGGVVGLALLVLFSGWFLGSTPTLLLFFALVAACGYAVYWVWQDAQRYY
jgi:hypothetical protein